MRAARPSALVLLSLALASLGACGPSAPSKHPDDVAVGKVAQKPIAAGARREPSKEILARWPFEKEADFAVYADLAGLTSTELLKHVGPALLAMKEVPEPIRRCARAALGSARELLAGAADGGSVIIVRVEGDAVQAACAPTLEEGGRVELAGATAAYSNKRDVVAFQPGWVIMGPRRAVEAVVSGKARGAAPKIALEGDELAAAAGHADDIAFRGGLTVNEERFRLAAELTFPTESDAQRVEAMVSSGRAAAGPQLGEELGANGDARKLIERLASAVGVTRVDKRVSIQFDLQEKPADQARDIDAMSVLAVSGVRRYLVRAKQAEAKNVLKQVSRDIVTWWEGEQLDAKGKLLNRATKKLFSIPATPQAIPKGVKYQSSPDDWKPWAPIRFEMSMPQYYQYEVKAAKDGKSADVIARGDLDGNGKASTFVLHLEVKQPKDMIQIARQIQETDPDE
jgi:hypothetical protein